jgi:hypothetical protein
MEIVPQDIGKVPHFNNGALYDDKKKRESKA